MNCSFAITEHNIVYPQHAVRSDFFRGMEILNDYGDFLVFGVDEESLQYRDIFALIEFIHEKHGVLVVAHPFGRHGIYTYCYAAVADKIVEQSDGVEVYNGKCLDEYNIRESRRVATFYNKVCVGGSDAHCAGDLFRVGTKFHHHIINEDALIHAIKSGACEPIMLRSDA